MYLIINYKIPPPSYILNVKNKYDILRVKFIKWKSVAEIRKCLRLRSYKSFCEGCTWVLLYGWATAGARDWPLMGERMMIKSWKLCGCAVLVLGLLLQGCSSNSSVNKTTKAQSVKEKVSLTYFGNKVSAHDVAAIEEILNEYMRARPNVTVTYESLKGLDYYKVLDKRLATGNGDDVFIVDHDHLKSYQQKGYLAKLNELPAMADYLPHVKQQMEENGSIYYAPTSISSFALFCNIDLLQKHNLKVPQTFPELKAACATFAAEGKKPLVVNKDLSLGTLIISSSWHSYYSMHKTEELYAAVNKKQQPMSQLLADGITKAFELLPYIDTEKCLGFKKNTDEYKEFAKGEAPFMLTGSWNNPRLAKLKPGFKYELHPYPVKDSGNILLTNVDTRVALNAKSKNLDASKDFLNFLLQSPKMAKFVQSQSSFGCMKSSEELKLSSENMQSLGKAYAAGNLMIGSDDRINYPIWTRGFMASMAILKGASRKKVEEIFDAE